ncbi:MAG: penicillin-binding transpeptidase domain-containing protein [Phycisphaerales bacterium]|nr:penicillin-binding transpeptidase domain-containing protein [Phycisphaerales bacterium]
MRLHTLQFTQAEESRKELQASLMARSIIETARGTIYDRKNVAIAYDKATYHLAMDYRAMNFDDGWLARTAADRITTAGETFANKAHRDRRVTELKNQIKQEIDAIPSVIARRCDTSEEEILAKFNKIREEIRELRISVWDFRQQRAKTGDDNFTRMLLEEKLTHMIVPQITDDQAFYFITHAQNFPGLIVLDSRTRVYPYKDVACQIIGSLHRVDKNHRARLPFRWPSLKSDDDEGQLDGYRTTDLIGIDGVEAKKEHVLHGSLGCRIFERGRPPPSPNDDAAPILDEDAASSPDRRIEPKFGQNVHVTIDINFQRDVEAALRDPTQRLLRGDDGKDHFAAIAVLAMDGQVLALVSTPGYDLNEAGAIRNDLNHDKYRRPLTSRALLGYIPGSTIKPLIAAAALSENLITPQSSITCSGHLRPDRRDRFRCDIFVTAGATHGPIQLVDALAKSCNIYFYTLGGRLGKDRLVSWLTAFGFGRDSGFELPDADGLIRPRDDDIVGELYLLGIGQGPVLATPLQMASAYATLLRGGQWIQPHIFADTEPRKEQAFRISSEHLAAIKDGMRRTVTAGTARRVMTLRIPVAGKTGTADVEKRRAFDDDGNPIFDFDRPLRNPDGTPKLGPDGRPLFEQATTSGTDAWFVGYVPADNPKFVIAAMMEFGGHGGTASVPIVKEVILQLQRHHYLSQMDVP